jgi:hypothetical protein
LCVFRAPLNYFLYFINTTSADENDDRVNEFVLIQGKRIPNLLLAETGGGLAIDLDLKEPIDLITNYKKEHMLLKLQNRFAMW